MNILTKEELEEEKQERKIESGVPASVFSVLFREHISFDLLLAFGEQKPRDNTK